jgi:regulator of protease activity HflC (stomatin/prohibitin superfamily)
MAHIIVMDWQRVLLYRNGRLDRVLEPGRHRYRRGRSTLVTVDTRPSLLTVYGQELLTSDGVTLRVSVSAVWRVVDPVAYNTGAKSPYEVLYAAVQEAIREAVSAVTLDEAFADRSRLSAGLVEATMELVPGLGIEVESARLRDLMLPAELRRAAMETVTARERGRADLERARAESAALRSLANAARLLEDHPALLHLRTLQVAAEPGTQVVLDPRRPARPE